ncbi:glycerophosphodiester phosphodiesterase [Christiangramia forsetii]|uniref:Glycerophosphoryl diester phosphodiesterase n=2 Tax=Christiangramia forsetii TaxID=411153 RepID=A0M7H8_CHRFK|nr:glycerophosphodiester phosphodiesterase family protein [Christiangramia forsetii]GGG27821.1 glycerophosphoryl diester phosphodiesterase [Christiangramia forsetii]CAL68573.1 glycerophosphoryl diester phosphodiesterase [Christiangramia forsetii KT0803]
MNNFLKIGHRGAKAHVAENTLESIQKALDIGVDMIEIDVHKCASGELWVIHDFTLDRTTNGSGEIAKKSAEELSKLKVENHFKIPLLTEVLDLIEGKCLINIELKGLNTATPVCMLLKKKITEGTWNYSDFIISSFQKNELFEVRNNDEQAPIAILSKASVPEAIELGKRLNAWTIHPSLGIITRDNTKLSQDAGFKVNVWTVNEREDIKRMIDFGVDGIISDYPNRLHNPVLNLNP